MRILRSITIRKASSRRSLMSLCYKTISSCCSCAYVEILSTWEVWRALKRLELHSAAPRATLTPLSCSPNFPRVQYLDIRTLMHELIVKYVFKSTKEVLKDFRSNQEDKLQHHLTSQGFFLSDVIKHSLSSVNSI